MKGMFWGITVLCLDQDGNYKGVHSHQNLIKYTLKLCTLILCKLDVNKVHLKKNPSTSPGILSSLARASSVLESHLNHGILMA